MRPEGWEKTIKAILDKAYNDGSLSDDRSLLEAGADAMLEGLKKEGTPQHLNCDDACSKRKGYLVFIEEKR